MDSYILTCQLDPALEGVLAGRNFFDHPVGFLRQLQPEGPKQHVIPENNLRIVYPGSKVLHYSHAIL
jgi:hypothetical protein